MSDAQTRILVVEDQTDLRDAMVQVLAAEGYDVIGAADATVAIAACRERDPAIILLDLRLPDLTGVEFVDAYRRLSGSKARILVVSAASDGAELSARVRADAYLSKPFDIDRLLAAVRRVQQRATES